MAFTFFLAMTVKTVANWPIWPNFGLKLETSQLLLHTIAMKAFTSHRRSSIQLANFDL